MSSVSWVRVTCVLAAAAALMACGDSVSVATGGHGGTGANEGGGTAAAGGTGGFPDPGSSNQVDLLLVVDNSRSMADKQEILAATVPQVLGYLTNPRCVDGAGVVVSQPADPNAACPAGASRQIPPVRDLQIGVITSSIGSHGADACDTTSFASLHASVNDRAHLISRSGTDVGDPTVATYQDLGFLAWDPGGAKSPPGEGNASNLSTTLASLIVGAGEVGCGYEAPLEAWYRFLVEPDPHESITIEGNGAVLNGTDQVVLDQRAAFVRPDSVLMVVMLADENDCSTRGGGQFFLVNQIFQPGTNVPYHLPKPRAACATDPNDPCCRSCGQMPGDGCDTSQDDCSGSLSMFDDNINVRCFDQKRRFGIDFSWPVERYTSGLSFVDVTDRFGNVVPNPLFTGGRDPSMVYLTGIVGVPWQDIARRDATGQPNIATGLDGQGVPKGGVMSPQELAANGVWDLIVGDLASDTPPTDPLMVESINPRSGTHPITGDAAAPPTAGYLANPMNGHERSIAQRDDLQYACIFPLPLPRDCSGVGAPSCDCNDPGNDNPLCQAPDGAFGTTQYFAKAYPGRRHLSVLESLGNQGVVGSICPVQLADGNQPGFGYQPTFITLVAAAAKSIAP